MVTVLCLTNSENAPVQAGELSAELRYTTGGYG